MKVEGHGIAIPNVIDTLTSPEITGRRDRVPWMNRAAGTFEGKPALPRRVFQQPARTRIAWTAMREKVRRPVS